MTWQVWLGLILCVMAVAAVGLAVYGTRRWAEAMQLLTCQLDACRIGQKALARYDSCDLDGLSAPVHRNFRVRETTLQALRQMFDGRAHSSSRPPAYAAEQIGPVNTHTSFMGRQLPSNSWWHRHTRI